MTRTLAIASMLTLAVCSQSRAQVFSPSDFILGGQVVNDEFVVGVAGFDGGVNNWPDGESPDHAIDGVGQKYLNFGRENTGFLVTPDAGSTVATRIKFWAANDAEPRDPASYELWGTNNAISGTGPFPLADFSPIASGNLALPSSRNAGGDSELLDMNSQLITFDNSDAYSSYLVVFPTVKDAPNANSMQIAEVQVNIPEPSTCVLAILLCGLAALRLRK